MENVLPLIILPQRTLISAYFGWECHTTALTLAHIIKEGALQWSGWSRGLNPWSGRVGSLERWSWPIGWCLDCVGDQGFSWIKSKWRGYSTVLKVASQRNTSACMCVCACDETGFIWFISLLSFKDDDPITGGAEGRDHIQRFLSQHHKKLPWKPEVMQPFPFPHQSINSWCWGKDQDTPAPFTTDLNKSLN